MSAESTVETIIADNRAAASDAAAQAVTYSNSAQTASQASLAFANLPNIDEPAVEIPPFINPDEDLGNAWRIELANAFADLNPKIADDVEDFVDQWFPAPCVQTSTDAWICDTIAGGLGLPVSVENAMWQRARENEVTDQLRREGEAVISFVGRGFAMPSGVLTSQLTVIRQETANKISSLNRDIIIKSAEIRIETVRFAVEQGIRLRLGLITALIDFIRARIALYDLMRSRAVSYTEAKRALWQGAAAYYQALLSLEELKLRRDIADIEFTLKDREIFAQAFVGLVQARTEAASAAAKTMGDQAAAALGSLNTLADIAHSTISSGT